MRKENENLLQTNPTRTFPKPFYRNHNLNFLVRYIMITAQKARNIQMLCIGEQSDRTYNEILEASI